MAPLKREWHGSSSGFVSVPVVSECFCNGVLISNFETQSTVNGRYTAGKSSLNGQPIWESLTHTIEFGNIFEGTWEILLKPDKTGAGRPAICTPETGSPGNPYECAD